MDRFEMSFLKELIGIVEKGEFGEWFFCGGCWVCLFFEIEIIKRVVDGVEKGV